MTNPADPRNTWRWAKLRRKRIAIARTNHEPCCRCGQPIDYRLNGNHRNGPTADHLDPIATGGNPYPDLEELAPAHRHCNSRHGQAISNTRQGLGPGSRGGNPDTWAPRKPRKAAQGQANPAPGPRDDRGAKRGERTAPAASSPADGSTPRQSQRFISDQPTRESIHDITTPFTTDPRRPGPADGLPLQFPPPHPDAVGSHGDAFVSHAEARLRADRFTRFKELRWWQWLVAQRLLEYRADGSWCHQVSFVSVSRQNGKTELLCELAVWRCAHKDLFGGWPQEVGHSASTVVLSRKVQSTRWAWASDAGLGVARQLGDSQVVWGDGSTWRTMAPSNMYGRSLDLILVDEAWSWDAEDFWQSTFPTVAERPDALVVLFSAAHDEPGTLLGTLLGNDDVAVMLWGAPADADPSDPAVWRAASPFWSPGRESAMRLAQAQPSFATQWLNRWQLRASRSVWADRAVLEGCRAEGLAPGRDRAVVGVALDRGSGLWPVAVACRDGGGVAVRLVGVFGSQDEAAAAASGAVGEACVLMLPRGLRGHVSLRGVRETVHAHEGDVSAAMDLCGVWAGSGRLRFGSGDEGALEALAALPARRVMGVFDAGTLLLLCAWWAARDRKVSAVV